MITQRALWAALAPAVFACSSRDAPADESYDDLLSGALVRAYLTAGGVVTGRLLATLAREDTLLLLCDAASAGPCASRSGPGALRLRRADVRRLAVRGTLGGHFALLGFYVGALAGTIKDRNDTGLLTVPSGVAVGALGAAIGSLIPGWVPLFPCGPHGPCGWRVAPDGGAPPGR